MSRVQVWTRVNWLLLPPSSFHATWFYITKISTWRISHSMRTHLQLLSKVSLWTELHWAILGGIKVSLSFNGSDHKCCRNGEERSCKPWWCPTAGNSSVCLITHSFHIILIARWYLAMQTGQRDSSQPMHKVFRVHRLFGPTKSAMVIRLYLLTSLLLSRSPWNCNIQSLSVKGLRPTRPLTPADSENFPSLRFGHGKVIT